MGMGAAIGTKRARGSSFSGALTLAIASWSPIAAAQVSNATAAESLASATAELLASGDTEEACRKLRASSGLDPSAARFLALGACWERAGKTASAWEAYRRAADAPGSERPDHAAAAREGEARLAPTLTRIQIDAPKDAAFIDLEVSLDGARFAPALYGVAIPVDPGTHWISAASPEHERWSLQLTLPPAPGITTVGVPTLQFASRPAAPAAKPNAPLPAPVDVQDRVANRGNSQRIVGLVLGGVGAAAIGTGVVFALKARDSRQDIARRCADGGCTARDMQFYDEASRNAVFANVALGLGAASLATGIIVYAVAPSAAPKKAASVRVLPQFGARSAGLVASGGF
jgi:hypothetical protein